MSLLDEFDVAVPVEPDGRVYIGHRCMAPAGQRGECHVTVHEGDRSRLVVHHPHHSPDGFEWGYSGSGPTELARCLLWDYLDCEPPPELYVDFRERFIAAAPRTGFVLTATAIAEWLGGRLRGGR